MTSKHFLLNERMEWRQFNSSSLCCSSITTSHENEGGITLDDFPETLLFYTIFDGLKHMEKMTHKRLKRKWAITQREILECQFLSLQETPDWVHQRLPE